MAINDTNIIVKVETFTLYARLQEGRYPNYNSVIPTNNTKTFVVSREAFLQCIRRVGIYSNPSTYQIRVSLEADNTSIRLRISTTQTRLTRASRVPIRALL